MSFRPYTDLVQKDITWFKDLEDYGKKSKQGVMEVIPGDADKRYRAWADPSLVNQSPSFFENFYEITTKTRTYKMIARDSSGYPLLTPIGSKEFKDTYATISNSANYRTYEQYSYMFPNGVPFLETKTLSTDKDKLQEPNFLGYTPGYDYPLVVNPLDMLVVQNGEVMTIRVEDFLKVVSVRNRTDEEKLDLVKKTLDRTDMTAFNKVRAIHEITISKQVVYPVI